MKKVMVYVRPGEGAEVEMPGNCNHPHVVVTCYAVHPSHPDCDCRWCVFNKEFKQAKRKERVEL